MFRHSHPGGEKVITRFAGRDATDVFYGLHRSDVLTKWAPQLQVGIIEGTDGDAPGLPFEEISDVPFAEHIAWRGYESPYYTDSHIELREEFRAWVNQHMRASGLAEELEESGARVPDELYHEMGQRG